MHRQARAASADAQVAIAHDQAGYITPIELVQDIDCACRRGDFGVPSRSGEVLSQPLGLVEPFGL